MAHDTESWLSSPTVGPTGTYELSIPCGGRVYSKATINARYSPEVRWQRSASNHTQKINGWRAPQPYYFKTIRSEPDDPASWYRTGLVGGSSCWYRNPTHNGCREGVQYSAYMGTTPMERFDFAWMANLRSWVKTKAVAKLNDSDLMLGVTFLERKTTNDMVVGRLKDMANFFRDVRRGRWGSLWQKAKRVDPFSLYLEYRYGWMQFVYDFNGLVDYIQDKEDGSYERLYVTVKSSLGKKGLDYHSSELTDLGNVRVDSKLYGKEYASTRLDFDFRDTPYLEAQSLIGSPATIAWEMVPMSFVIDWFLNVGTWLDAWSFLPYFHYRSGSSTVFGKYEEYLTTLPGSAFCSYDRFKSESVFFQRWVETNPYPALAFDPKALLGKFSQKRVADGVSLLIQQLKGYKGF